MDKTELDGRLRSLAEGQHSMVSWRQARVMGATRKALAGRVLSDTLVEHRRVA